VARYTVYSMTTKAERVVCLDGVFRCPNPACGYVSPFRAWGRGRAENKVEKKHISPTIPGAMRLATKQTAERNAWADAQQKCASLACPRCARPPLEGLQFLHP
jgi:hypothetical protein